MQKIIGGLLYDTDQAEEICDVSGPNGLLATNELAYQDTRLYRTAKGAFFIAGTSGALGPWSRSVGQMTAGGSGMQVIPEDEARELVARHSSVETYTRLFGPPAAA